MKRDIRCKQCADRLEELTKNYSDEHCVVVKGVARRDYSCDGCVPINPIQKGDTCYAVSLWSDSMAPHARYEAGAGWEHEYLDIKAGQPTTLSREE